MRDVFGNGLARIHEGDEPFGDLALAHARGGNLGQPVVMERNAGGFGVDDHHVLIERAEIGCLGGILQPAISLFDAHGGAFVDVFFYRVSGHIPIFSNRVQPIMNQRMQKHRAVIDKEKNMPATPYYGTYCRFKTADKKAGSQLLGADNLVGDVFDVYFKQEGVETIAWMKNRFGADIGYFDADISRDLQLCQVKGWSLHAVLASVYFTDSPEPGEFWEKPPLSAMTRNMKPHSMRSPRESPE